MGFHQPPPLPSQFQNPPSAPAPLMPCSPSGQAAAFVRKTFLLRRNGTKIKKRALTEVLQFTPSRWKRGRYSATNCSKVLMPWTNFPSAIPAIQTPPPEAEGRHEGSRVPPGFPIKLTSPPLRSSGIWLLAAARHCQGDLCKYDNTGETNYLRLELISVSQQGSAVTPLGLEMPLFG